VRNDGCPELKADVLLKDIDGWPELRDGRGEDLLGRDVSSKIVELLVGVF
jgi:hypothetical protein